MRDGFGDAFAARVECAPGATGPPRGGPCIADAALAQPRAAASAGAPLRPTE